MRVALLAVAVCWVARLAVADTERVGSERHLRSFTEESCDFGCDVFLYSRSNPASLRRLNEIRARPGVPLALVHAPDTETYRDAATPKLLSIQGTRRRARVLSDADAPAPRNFYRYDEVAGGLDRWRRVRVMVLGGVLPGQFVSRFSKDADAEPDRELVYVYVHPALEHGSRRVLELHQTFARHLGASGHDTHFYDLRDGVVVWEGRCKHPQHYAKAMGGRVN